MLASGKDGDLLRSEQDFLQAMGEESSFEKIFCEMIPLTDFFPLLFSFAT